MSNPDPNTLRDALKQADSPPPLRDKQEFWSDFRARAALVNREATAAIAERSRRRALVLTTVGATAVALVVLLAILPALDAPNGPAAADASRLSDVESVTVEVDYDTLMIVEDKENGGTLIWMDGLQTNPPPQRNEES